MTADRAVPLVTVVIPVRAPSQFLEEAVASALVQTFKDLAVIVVDDSATGDPPVSIRAVDPRLTVHRFNCNRGPAAARNFGWRAHPEARFVAFLDADDTWDPSKIEQQVAYASTHGDCVGVGCLMRYVSSEGAMLGTAGHIIDERDHDRIASGSLFPFQLSSVLVRRDALVRIDGFDEALGRVGSEDLDLLARLADCGGIAGLPVTLGSYRIHRNSAMARYRSRINRGARFVRERIVARRAGRDLTWDAFVALDHPSWADRRRDAVERCYRSAAVWHAERRPMRAFAYGLAALAIDPWYTLKRIQRQRGLLAVHGRATS